MSVGVVPPGMRTVHEGTGFGEFLEGSTEQESRVAGDIDILTGPVKESFGFAATGCPTKEDF